MQQTQEHKLDWNAKLMKYFSENARLVALITIFIIIGGIVSLASLKREGFPQVSPKIVLVQTLYPGATAEEVESQVTKEIETAVKDVKNVKDISSTSQNSFSNVVINFKESVNLDQSVQDVQAKLQSARANLPQDAEQSKVNTFSTGGAAFVFGVSGSQDEETIRNQAIKFTDELQNVKGVKSAKLQDEPEKRILVTYRLGELAAKGVNVQALSQILQAANVDFPVGTLPINNKQQAVITKGAFESLDDIKNLIVGINPATGQPVLLRDIADVSSQIDGNDTIHRFGYQKDNELVSRPGFLVNTEIEESADIIKTRDEINAFITKLRDDKKIAGETDIVPVSDQAKSTEAQITEILEGALGAKRNLYILGGLQLLFIAMLLFVNFRAAFVSALSIPLSLFFTFIALYLMGINLNTIVLFSLILVLGLIVDPAIVIVEAIQRYRDLRYTSHDAVLESGRRYGAALFMAVLTSLLVFVPFGVVSGVFGEIIKYIPLTVIPALFASYFVPMALLPLFTKWLLKSRKTNNLTTQTTASIESIASDDEQLSTPAKFVMKVNTWVLAKKTRQIGALIISFVLVGLSLSLVGVGKVNIVQFSKPSDNEFLLLTTAFQKGMTFGDRDATAQKIEEKLRSEEALKEFYYYSQNKDSLIIFLNLKDKADRKSNELKSKQVVERLKNEVKQIERLDDVLVTELSNGPPESDYQIQTQVYASDIPTLEKAAKNIGDFLRTQEHVIRVDDGFTDKADPSIQISLNRDKVQRAGLSSFEIGQQLKSLVEPTKLTKFEDSTTGEQQEVYIVSDVKPRTSDDIANMPLVSRTGARLTVKDIANIEEAGSVSAIQRFNGLRNVNIQARVSDATHTFDVQNKLNAYLTDEKMKELNLLGRDNRGDTDDIAESFQQLFIALGAAVLLTYIVLVIQFKSFSQPLVMLFTIPLSLIGVFPALWLSKSDLGFLELLGVTILVGIVENVAIFLIDYANQLVKEKGMDVRQAIILASGVRFRPILLTKLVALGGLLPLAIESDFWRGLSVVIIAGIGISGFFSLVIIPILYVWIDYIRTTVKTRVLRRNK